MQKKGLQEKYYSKKNPWSGWEEKTAMHVPGWVLELMKQEKCLHGKTGYSGFLRKQENQGDNAVSTSTTFPGKICQRKHLLCIHHLLYLSSALNWGWDILLIVWISFLSISQLKVVLESSEAQFSIQVWQDTKSEQLKYLCQSFSNLRELWGCLQDDFIHRSLQQLQLLMT